MDRGYMRGRYEDGEFRGLGAQLRGRRGRHGGERGSDGDPQRHRREYDERSDTRDASAHGYGPYQRDLYGQDQRGLYGRDEQDASQPSEGEYDRPGEQDWRGAPQPGFSGPVRGDWQKLYRDEPYPDRGGFGRGDYDVRSDYDQDMPRAYRDRDYRGRNEHGRRGYNGPRSGGDRGFLDRASNEVASWFGDEDAEQRRDQDHRGRAPRPTGGPTAGSRQT